MKANRKFIIDDEDAVSPVIAVILMVAITVVLAATVYVWVSGFGAEQGSGSRTVALTSAGGIDSQGEWKNYTVASATPGLKYSDMKITIEGDELTFKTAEPNWGDSKSWALKSGGAFVGSTDNLVKAGDKIHLKYNSTMAGKQLQILDTDANSFLNQLTIS